MKLPNDIEREIKAIEHDTLRGGQMAGQPRLRGLRAAIEAELKTKFEAGKVWSAMTHDERIESFLFWRMVHGKACDRCFGSGKLVYATTSTWHGGVGGSAMTTDVCDRCWGSGEEERTGVNLRTLYAELDSLRRQVKKG